MKQIMSKMVVVMRMRQMVALSLIMILMVSSFELSAKKKQLGAIITVNKIDGTMIEGELIRVTPFTLTIMRTDTLTGVLVDSKEVSSIQLPKDKSKGDRKHSGGFVIGAIVGGVLGGLVCGSASKNLAEDSFGKGAVIGVPVGALLGGMIGSTFGGIAGSIKNASQKHRILQIKDIPANQLADTFLELNQMAKFPEKNLFAPSQTH